EERGALCDQQRQGCRGSQSAPRSSRFKTASTTLPSKALHTSEMHVMLMDTFLLSRIQFAANISFHILFPTITIALCWFLLFFRVQFNRTNDEVWMRCYRFWVKIFALSFAVGVVSGLVMSFQ